MLLFGHIGITLGAALVVSETWRRLKHVDPDDRSPVHQTFAPSSLKPLLLTLAACAVGSLLPDIIDKPLGHFLFPAFFGYNGRIMAHTLIFLLLVLSLGLALYPRRIGALVLILAFGDAMHLVLDQMWLTPRTLLWPLLGWGFPRTTEYSFLGSIWTEYFHDPSAYIPELIGFGILCLCGLWLIASRRLLRPR